MAKQCIEYKKHRNYKGELVDPPWEIDGGYFYDADTKTYLGFVPVVSEREYYIDDTVTIIDKTEFVERAIRVCGFVEGETYIDSDKLVEEFDPTKPLPDLSKIGGSAITYHQSVDAINDLWAKKTGA